MFKSDNIEEVGMVVGAAPINYSPHAAFAGTDETIFSWH